ncbi:N-acetylglucosamine-6-phosphate deacetylase [Marinimicrobium alkaliphilum]|uniref:N-acetylglucosamine-6-phosphate deacetylase n=1 Tax=Marinimicrobium alkaliphilum TaxID=2202654 RepID=UPI000DB9C4C6|nr:N-acetylglucosamine-6-phosphate deacetylase [Marinimicrobium alkaliphilum]
MTQALSNARIFTGDHWLDDHVLVYRGEYIIDLISQHQLPSDLPSTNLGGALLVPGLLDTQVNGGGGVLFNDAPTVDALKTLSAAHRPFGTTGLLPTLISDDFAVMTRGIAAITQAMDEGVPGILGIHLEGPFLNEQRKGVHDPKKFRSIDDEALALLCSLKRGKTLVTLAPELTTPDAIRTLTEAGVIVAAGHTGATYEQIHTALRAGLSSFTHLFNAMTPMTSREPGVVGAALEDPNSWCGLIVDGYHVHPATLKVAIAAKPKGKMILVSDAMPSVGAEEKSFVLKGETIRAENGRCATPDGTLAGSDLDMLSAVRNSVRDLDLTLGEALRMASRYPAAMLGLDHELGSLAPGYRASMIAIDSQLNMHNSWINGEPLSP